MSKVVIKNGDDHAFVKITEATETITLSDLEFEGVTPSHMGISCAFWSIADNEQVLVKRGASGTVNILSLSSTGSAQFKENAATLMEESDTPIVVSAKSNQYYMMILGIEKFP